MIKHRLILLLSVLILSFQADAHFVYGNFRERSLKEIPEPVLRALDDAPPVRPDTTRRVSLAYIPADSGVYKKWQKAEKGREDIHYGSIIMAGGAAIVGIDVAVTNLSNKDLGVKPLIWGLVGTALFTIGLGKLIGGSATRARYWKYRKKPPTAT